MTYYPKRGENPFWVAIWTFLDFLVTLIVVVFGIVAVWRWGAGWKIMLIVSGCIVCGAGAAFFVRRHMKQGRPE